MNKNILTPSAFWHELAVVCKDRPWTLVASGGGKARWHGWATDQTILPPHQTVIVDPRRWDVDETALDYTGMVVAFGGGYVIDAAKQIAARLGIPGCKSLAGFAQARASGHFSPPPIAAVPTVSGSGSEVTPFASVWRGGKKSSIEAPELAPVHLFMVPEFAEGVPLSQAVASALDALSHATEAVWNVNATDETDAFATAAIADLAGAFRRGRLLNDSRQDRAAIMRASAAAGKAITKTHTAIAHSISYPMTGELGVLHGVASSFALPSIAKFNLFEAPARMARIASALKCELLEVPEVLGRILRGCHVTELFPLPSPKGVSAIRAPLVDAARAPNNIRAVSERDARIIAVEAMEALHAA